MSENTLPHFQLCCCGKHGRVVFPDGRTSGEMFSKKEALIALQYASLVGGFQGVDIFPDGAEAVLVEEIEKSSLPKSKSHVTDHTKKVFLTWNTAKLFQPSLNPDDFHEVDTKLWHYRAGD